MADLTAYAQKDECGSITWRVYITEPRVKENGRWRRYRGLRSKGHKSESLTSVLTRAFIMHKASMLVCGRVATNIESAMFFDERGRVIKPPRSVSLRDLCTNK